MNKKTLLIFLLTAVSATTVAAAGCAKKHQHNYSWQTNAEEHWLKCDCGDTKNEGAHIDEVNNTSQSAGSDGLCDVCGLKNYAVTFNMNGHGTAPENQIIYKGGKAVKPATDPSAENVSFGGWYADAECTSPFDFTAEINSAVTVYVKWTVTVTFNMNGCGTAPAAQAVKVDGKAVKPATDPIDENSEYVFSGWYADEVCETPFDFNSAISEDTTVYAKWVLDTRPLVTFDFGAASKDALHQRVEVGGSVVKPEDPEVYHWIFEGWYADEDCNEEFDFENTQITEDITVYAKLTYDKRPYISFDVQGHGTAPAMQKVEYGEFVVEPEAPSAEGLTFAGWYVDTSFNSVGLFNFEYEVTEDLTLYAKWTATVTFDVGGHGTAPKAEVVTEGKKLDANKSYVPSTSEDLDFVGWFADAECTVPFDFDAPVTTSVTVYAKWAPGLPQLVLEQQKLVTFDGENSLQFVFVAPETGRYYISPGNLKTYACYFNTSLDEEGVYYGEGYDSNEDYLDLSAGQKITVTLYRGEGIEDTTKVCLIVNQVTNEPFPAEGWVSGEYTNGTITIEFERDDSRNIRKVTWNNVEYTITSYLGGSYNSAYFVTSTYSCTLKQTAEDTFLFTYKDNGNGNSNSVTLQRVLPQAPIPVTAFGGVYKPAGTAQVDGITQIGVYESGNGYTVGSATIKYTLGQSGSRYDQENNALYFGSYMITANLDENGNVESINVRNTSSMNNPTVVYNKTGIAPVELPDKLPLPAIIELAGETLGIVCNNGTQKWSDNSAITITGYDKDNEIYTVKFGSTIYTLEIEGSGDDTVVKVYNSTHTNLVDTLAKKSLQVKTFVADGSQITFTANETTGSWKSVFYTVPVTGKYTFNASTMNLALYINVEDMTVSGIGGKQFYKGVYEETGKFNNDGTPITVYKKYDEPIIVDLVEGSVVAFSIIDCASSVNSFWFTATFEESSGNANGTQAAPYTANVGINELENTESNNWYYFEFTADTDGVYQFAYWYVPSWGGIDRATEFKVGDTVFGNTWESGWFDDGTGEPMSYSNYYAKVSLTAGQKVVIAINGKSSELATLEIKKA